MVFPIESLQLKTDKITNLNSFLPITYSDNFDLYPFFLNQFEFKIYPSSNLIQPFTEFPDRIVQLCVLRQDCVQLRTIFSISCRRSHSTVKRFSHNNNFGNVLDCTNKIQEIKLKLKYSSKESDI